MSKPFFEVFPSLQLNTDIRDLMGQTEVERVSATKRRDFLRVYLKSTRLIQKADIWTTEGRIYGHFRTEPGTDGTGTFGICQTEQSGTFQHFCELTRLSEKGYSNRHMRMTRKVRCPYER